MNSKTIYTSEDGASYLCLVCVRYVPCGCTPAPKLKTKWSSKITYEARFTENVNYGALLEDGKLEIEDRDGCDHFDLDAIEEANCFFKAFVPYTRGDGALIFSLDIDGREVRNGCARLAASLRPNVRATWWRILELDGGPGMSLLMCLKYMLVRIRLRFMVWLVCFVLCVVLCFMCMAK